MKIVEHEDKTATIYIKTHSDFREMLIEYLHKKNLDNFTVTGFKDSFCEEVIRTISINVKQKDG